MKLLLTTCRVFTWICVRPVDKSSSKWKKILFPVATFVGFLEIFLVIAGSTAYFCQIVSSNLEEALYTFEQIVAFSMIVYMMTSALFLRSEFNEVYDSLSSIYKKCKLKNLMKEAFIFKIEFLLI